MDDLLWSLLILRWIPEPHLVPLGTSAFPKAVGVHEHAHSLEFSLVCRVGGGGWEAAAAESGEPIACL